MALTYDQVTGLTHALINESGADNIYNSNALFSHLKERGQIVEDGGKRILLPITWAKVSAAGSYNRYDILDTTPNETETAAEWKWKYNYAHVIISKAELLENSGKSQAVSLLKAKTKNAMAALRDNIGTDMFGTNGDSATGVNGLRLTVSSAGTAGGIASTDFSGWAAKSDATVTALALSQMEQAFLSAANGSDEPDIIVTTKPIFAKYHSLLTANQRYGEAQTGKGGFRYLLFNDVPIFHDSHVTAKYMYMLNTRWLYLFVHRDDNMKVEKIGSPANQNVHIDRVTLTCNLVTDNRRMHHKFSVLNYT